VFEQLAELEQELEKLEARLSDVYASGDQAAARDAGRRHAELKPIVVKGKASKDVLADSPTTTETVRPGLSVVTRR